MNFTGINSTLIWYAPDYGCKIKNISVKEISSEGDIGYTMRPKESTAEVHINFGKLNSFAVEWANKNPETAKKLFPGVAKALLFPSLEKILGAGILLHEVAGHQFFTNWDELQKRAEKRCSRLEKKVYRLLFNLVEDPRVEQLILSELPDKFTRPLRMTRRILYELAPGIDPAAPAMAQLITALIDLGDEGIVKGTFSDTPEGEEAKKIFAEVAPIFCRGIEASNTEVYDFVDEIFELSRPLWEKDAEKAAEIDKLIGELQKALEKRAKNGVSTGCGKGYNPEPTSSSKSPDPKAKRRAAAISKIVEELSDPEKEKSGSHSDTSEKSEGKPKGALKDSSAEGIESDELKDAATKGDEGENPSGKASSSDPGSGDGEDFSPFSKEDLEKIEGEEEESPSKGTIPKHWEIKLEGGRKVQSDECNEISGDKNEYNRIISGVRSRCRGEALKIRKLIDATSLNRSYGTDGEISPDRFEHRIYSENIFERINVPEDKKDLAVFILVDMSGSMDGRKISEARKATCMLAEIFGDCGLPLYIMGFTADYNGHDYSSSAAPAYHFHFIKWNNKPELRPRLTALRAIANNADGISIRRASEILSRRPESKKLLVVISDGEPAASIYSSGNGYGDTVAAIKEAKKRGQSVLGLGLCLSPSAKEIFMKFYRDDFILVDKAELLFGSLVKKIERLLK